MKTDNIARIILQPDGSVHIALRDCQTYACTAVALKKLLEDPYAFEEKGYLSQTNTSRDVNPKRFSCDEIPGVTLATLSTEMCLSFVFVDLFLLAYKKANTSEEYDILNLKPVINQLAIKDRKQSLLDYYFQSVSNVNIRTPTSHEIHLSTETQTDILREIVNACCVQDNTSLSSTIARAEFQALSDKPILDSPAYIREDGIPSNYVTVNEFAALKNVVPNTVLRWLKNNKIPSAITTKNGQWRIDPNVTISDHRAKRRSQKDVLTGRKYVTLQENSHEKLQEYIKKRKLVTDNIRPFIRTFEEIKYYEKNGYHEVSWDGIHALIIDIRPHYFSKLHGKTNIELIQEGKSPVIPGDEKHVYHLHHIGQQLNSPFAIFPETAHNSKDLYSFLHQGKTEETELHSKSYELEKRAFWMKYLEVYLKYKEYGRIPFENSKHTRNKR